MEWNFIDTTNAPPATGQLRLNNSDQQSTTLMWVHKTTADSVATGSTLLQVIEGDEIYMQDKDDPTKWQTYRVNGELSDKGVYVQYPIEWLRGQGTVPQQRITVLVQRAVEPPVEQPFEPRLTLRQWYAAHAMTGLLSQRTSLANLKDRSEWAFRIADQMIQFEADEAANIPTPMVGALRKRR